MVKLDYPSKIKKYREKYFLSQTDFGKIVGVSYVTVNRWENGHFKPTIKCKKILNDLFIKDMENDK